MSVEQVKAHIAAGARDADVALGLLAKVMDTVDDALRGARHTTHDSQHPKVTDGLGKLGQAKTELEKITALLRTSIQAARNYARTLG